MDEINIGDEIVFNITGNHNIGYTKGEKYIGTVLSKDHRSRLYVRTIGMPRACIDERDVDKIIDTGDISQGICSQMNFRYRFMLHRQDKLLTPAVELDSHVESLIVSDIHCCIDCFHVLADCQ